MLLHLAPNILNRRLLRHSECLWELIVVQLIWVHALHSHLLLHKRHLRLLRVQELLLLLCLTLANVKYSFQMRLEVSFVRLLCRLLGNELAPVWITHPVGTCLKFLLLERHCRTEGFAQIMLGFD